MITDSPGEDRMPGIDVAPQPQVHVHGPVSPGAVVYARTKVAAALRLAPRPVLFVRLTLDRATSPAVERPYTARVHVDVSGVEVHARASAPSSTEAADLLQRRLRGKLTASRWH